MKANKKKITPPQSIEIDEALRKSEERFQAVLESSRDVLVCFNLQTNSYEYISPSVKELVGYSPEEFIGMDRETALAMVYPDDVQVLQEAQAHSAETGQADAEYRQRHKNGNWVWVSNLISVTKDDAGRPLYRNSCIRDITEHKKNEESVTTAHRQNQIIIDNTPAIVYAFDLEERFIMANAALAELLNSTPEQMIGKKRHEFMPREDADWHEANDRQVIEAGKALEFEEYSQLAGHSITWLTTKFPLWDAQGRMYAVAGISSNITERKKTEEAIQKYAGDLENANKELEAFNYSVSHDLRQPLRALESFSDLLALEYKDKLDETGQDYISRVKKAAQFMSQLTDDMLELSRINRAEMYRDNVNLSEIAQAVVEELKAGQPERKADIRLNPNLTAIGDKPLLTIALRNLLENAWKFTGKCRQTCIEIGKLERDGGIVYFIKDNGIGFDMRYINKIFQPFQRLTTDKAYPGTGIGLAIVHRVILRHGGKVWAEAEAEQGATFYFTLGERG